MRSDSRRRSRWFLAEMMEWRRVAVYLGEVGGGIEVSTVGLVERYARRDYTQLFGSRIVWFECLRNVSPVCKFGEVVGFGVDVLYLGRGRSGVVEVSVEGNW